MNFKTELKIGDFVKLKHPLFAFHENQTYSPINPTPVMVVHKIGHETYDYVTDNYSINMDLICCQWFDCRLCLQERIFNVLNLIKIIFEDATDESADNS